MLWCVATYTHRELTNLTEKVKQLCWVAVTRRRRTRHLSIDTNSNRKKGNGTWLFDAQGTLLCTHSREFTQKCQYKRKWNWLCRVSIRGMQSTNRIYWPSLVTSNHFIVAMKSGIARFAQPAKMSEVTVLRVRISPQFCSGNDSIQIRNLIQWDTVRSWPGGVCKTPNGCGILAAVVAKWENAAFSVRGIKLANRKCFGQNLCVMHRGNTQIWNWNSYIF